MGNVPSSLAKGEDRFNKVNKDPRAGIATFDDVELDIDELGGSFLFSSKSYMVIQSCNYFWSMSG
jgi:hypothetical protein